MVGPMGFKFFGPREVVVGLSRVPSIFDFPTISFRPATSPLHFFPYPPSKSDTISAFCPVAPPAAGGKEGSLPLRMKIGLLPPNFRHVARVTFDRFNGLRGFPVEFEPVVSRRASGATRSQISLPARLFFCQAKFADSGIDGSFSSRVVPPPLLAAEREEAKAVLTLFLKKQGLSNANAARIINKSDLFIDHLVSRLHSVHKSRYLVGRELTTLEIRDALTPYLEYLLEEHGSTLVDLVENFPNPPDKGKPIGPISPSDLTLNSKKLKAVSRVSERGATGKLPPHILYLMDLGMDQEQIKGITRRFPAFAYYSLEGKVKPVVEFLFDLGVSKSELPIILTKRPQLCGISLSDNLIPTMSFLEKLGVDKRKWAKVIYRFPALLTYSRQKVEATVGFLYEMGLSEESIGKILTRCPNIISYSVEEKLRPTAKYFLSLGVNISLLLYRCPQVFGLSIEANLKPVTQFFLGRGYSVDEIGTMISRYGALYTFSLQENVTPKWEFFLTMDYPKEELVKFPQYFGYSLEERIKPRYALVKESGVKLLLNQVLSLSYDNFNDALQKKLQKMFPDKDNDTN